MFIVLPSAPLIVALAFMPARPGSCRALFSCLFTPITISCAPLLVIFDVFSSRTRAAVSQTHSSPETALRRPPHLLSHSLHQRSHPLLPLRPHCEMGPSDPPANCGTTILLPSCLLSDARSLARIASG